MERAHVAGKCSVGPSCGCTQEPGGRDVPARGPSCAFSYLGLPKKKTLATHTNFRTQRGRKTSLQIKLVLFPFFTISANLGPSPHLLFPQWASRARRRGGRETIEHPGSRGCAEPKDHWEPSLERLVLSSEPPPLESSLHAQNYWPKPVLNLIFSAPSHFPG